MLRARRHSFIAGGKPRKRNTPMEVLVWLGAVVSVIGLVGLMWCIVIVARAKRAGLDEAAMRERIQGVVAINMGALCLSVLGLIMVIVGILLG